MEPVTRTLAGFASRLSFDQLKPELVGSFKMYLLDAIGCGLHGASQPWARIINRWVWNSRENPKRPCGAISSRGPRRTWPWAWE